MKKILITLITLIALFGFTFLQEHDCGEPVNIWYKVSTDSISLGQVIKLDMSTGHSYSDGIYIYLIVKDLDTGENVFIAFPNGGEWVAQTQDPFLDALDKEFKDLEDYLKNSKKKGEPIQKIE